MNKRIIIFENVLWIVFSIGVLACSFGREFFKDEVVNCLFWFSLGLLLGFQLYKYEIIRMWKKENKNRVSHKEKE